MDDSQNWTEPVDKNKLPPAVAALRQTIKVVKKKVQYYTQCRETNFRSNDRTTVRNTFHYTVSVLQPVSLHYNCVGARAVPLLLRRSTCHGRCN